MGDRTSTLEQENTLIAMVAEACRQQCGSDSRHAGYLLLASAALLLAEVDEPAEEAAQTLSENISNARLGLEAVRAGGVQ